MGLFPISASQLLREAAAGLELLFLKPIWSLEIGFFDRKSPAHSLLCVHTFFSEKAGDVLVNPHPVTGLIFPPKKTQQDKNQSELNHSRTCRETFNIFLSISVTNKVWDTVT